jgi:hypothetical protein
LRRSLSDLQLLGDALACHVVRPPRRRKQTSLQTSRRIVDEGDIGQSRPTKPRPQLESFLKHLLVFLVRGVLDNDGVVTFADFAALLGFAFPLLRDIFKSGRRSRLRDKLYNVILQQVHWVSTTTTT